MGQGLYLSLHWGYNTIIFKHVYWYMQQISGERLQDHWSSGFQFVMVIYLSFHLGFLGGKYLIQERSFRCHVLEQDFFYIASDIDMHYLIRLLQMGMFSRIVNKLAHVLHLALENCLKKVSTPFTSVF